MNPVDKNSSAFDATLRRALGQAPNAGTPQCPDAALIAAYCDRSLGAGEVLRLELHFSDCARCQMQLAAIARTDKTAGAVIRAGRFYKIRGWWMAIPIFAAAAALVVTILTVRPSGDRMRGEQMAALDKLAARPAPVLASAPQSPVGALAMNEARPAQRRDIEQIPESAGPGTRAKTLAKSKQQLEAKAQQAPRADLGGVAASNNTAAVVSAPESPAVADKPDVFSSALGNLQQGRARASAQMAAGAAAPVARPAVAKGETSLQSFSRSLLPDRPESASGAAGSAQQFSQSPVGAGMLFALASIPSPDRTATWIVGKNGTIVVRDARGNARAQRSGVTTDLTAGASVSAQVCWVVGRSGTVIRTIDGEHWALVTSPTRDNLVSVAADSSDDAIVRAASGQSFATSDGGKSWHPQ